MNCGCRKKLEEINLCDARFYLTRVVLFLAFPASHLDLIKFHTDGLKGKCRDVLRGGTPWR